MITPTLALRPSTAFPGSFEASPFEELTVKETMAALKVLAK
jgi:hypothetical protein